MFIDLCGRFVTVQLHDCATKVLKHAHVDQTNASKPKHKTSSQLFEWRSHPKLHWDAACSPHTGLSVMGKAP